MIELPFVFAGTDPLGHILDHPWLQLGPVNITLHMAMMALSAALCLTLFPYVARKISGGATGGRFANFWEVLLLFIRDEMVEPFLGKDTNRFMPIIWTFFFLILFCNLLGLIPGSYTATSNISITAGLAVCAFVIYHAAGIKRNGLVHYTKANLLVGPWFLWPLMVPIEIFGHIVRPCALAVRLFANMVGGHVLLAVIVSFTLIQSGDALATKLPVSLVAAGGVLALNFLELLVAFIQAFVFAFLTTVFLSLSLHPDH